MFLIAKLTMHRAQALIPGRAAVQSWEPGADRTPSAKCHKRVKPFQIQLADDSVICLVNLVMFFSLIPDE